MWILRSNFDFMHSQILYKSKKKFGSRTHHYKTKNERQKMNMKKENPLPDQSETEVRVFGRGLNLIKKYFWFMKNEKKLVVECSESNATPE